MRCHNLKVKISHPATSEYTPTEPMEVDGPQRENDLPMDASEVPIPDESNDELFVFGDDQSFPSRANDDL